MNHRFLALVFTVCMVFTGAYRGLSEASQITDIAQTEQNFVEVDAMDLNLGAWRPDYEAGAVIIITGSADLTRESWEVLRALDREFALVLKNGQSTIPDGAMAPYYEYMNNSFPLITSFTAEDALTVGDYAFEGCQNLWSVSLPSVVRIGDSAFSGAALSEANIPEVRFIGSGAFNYCEYLEGVSFSKAAEIGDSAFASSGLKQVNLPAARLIGESAFSKCASLVEVVLPSAESVGKSAFIACWELTVFSLPEARSIGQMAFFDCRKLSTLDLPSAKVIGDAAFSWSWTSDYGTGGGIVSLDIPQVEEIGARAFGYCGALRSVNMPSVRSIGSYAFMRAGLPVADLPSLVNVDDYAFWKCDGLVSADMPLAERIGYAAFESCVNLVSVNMPSVRTIRENAFYYCRGLSEVRAQSVIDVGDGSFAYCGNIPAISLPSARRVGGNALEGCENLSAVSLPLVEYIGPGAFRDTYDHFFQANYSGLSSLYLGSADPEMGSGTPFPHVNWALKLPYDTMQEIDIFIASGNALSRGKYHDRTTKYVAPAPVLTLSIASTDIVSGESARLEPALCLRPNGVSLAMPPSYIWSSLNPGVASVGADGRVKGLSAGTARIVCSAEVYLNVTGNGGGKTAVFPWAVSRDVTVTVTVKSGTASQNPCTYARM
ncbi:MAG: leucine-rich repeat protein [Synergistaceae bacterium]|jgi:hypothetical protein|nr:leucine-rich repeat protein [Synergistaceae bacterium]